MQQFRLFGLLLKPSLFSAIISLILAAVVLGLSNIPYVRGSAVLNDYLFGPSGLVSQLEQPQTNMLTIVADMFDMPLTYNILILVVALVCGLLVYVFLEGFTKGVGSAKKDLEEVRLANLQSRRALQVQVATRWALRLVSFAAWLVYWAFWISILLPFSILSSRIGIGELPMPYGWLFLLIGFSVFVVSIHFHVVFMRLITLRPRLFGGEKVIESEL